MKRPLSAPSLATLLADPELSSKAFQFGLQPEIATLVDRAMSEGWNYKDCRYRARANGVHPDLLWIRVKFGRISKRTIPLIDGQGQPFGYALLAPMHPLLHEIDLHLGGSIGSIAGALEGEADRQRYLLRSLREEAIASSLIEGAVVTRSEARELIRTDRKPRTHGERMVVNNYRTIRELNRRRDEPMTPEFLLDIQAMLTEGAIDTPGGEGRFRRPDEPIHIFDEEQGEPIYFPPPADQLPERLKLFCAFANATTDPSDRRGFLHPALRAILLHFWLAHDHPFVDGNGRTARALFYWSMLRQGYWLTEYISISKIIQQQLKKYYRAFQDTERDENDLSYFILYHLDVVQRGLKELRDYLDAKMQDVKEMAVLKREGLNARQIAIIARALQDPSTAFTYRSHANSHGVTSITARSDLLDLMKRKLLVQNRSGRAFEFLAIRDLPEKIAKWKRRG